MLVRDAEIPAAPRRIETERHGPSSGVRHRKRAWIVTVQDLQAGAREDARLRGGVLVEARVAVEVILGEIEHRRRGGRERPRRLELIAGELEHPRFGKLSRVLPFRARLQYGRPDVSGDFAVDARGAQQMTG